MALHLTQDPEADALLDRDPFALLCGMLLDQQFPMERAFAGPQIIASRLGVERLDPRAVAGIPAQEFADLCSKTPAIHRFPGSMAGRVQALAQIVADEYDDDAALLWTTASTGAELLKRVSALPGFGSQKARIFVALLGKQLGVRPDGWREASNPYGEDGTHKSVADVTDEGSLGAVRAYKQEAKRAAKAKDEAR